MTAPIRLTPEYELYRVITDMDALQEAFRDRVEDLDTTRAAIDEVGNLQSGYAGKLLCQPPIKAIGKDSLPKMLRATGMVLVLVIDDDRFAEVKARLVKRKRPPSIAGKMKPKWLFTKDKAREMGKRRFALMSDTERKRHQRKAQRASVKARRRRAVAKQQEAQLTG